MEDSDALVGESILTLQTGFSHIYNPVNTKSRDTQVINTSQLEIAKKSMFVQKNSSWWASSWKPQTLKLRLWIHKLFASCGSELICRFIVSWALRPCLWRHQESTRRIIQNLAFVKFHPFAFFFRKSWFTILCQIFRHLRNETFNLSNKIHIKNILEREAVGDFT